MIYHPERLIGVHPKLKKIIEELGKHLNFLVVCGFRNEIDQNKAFREGRSKAKWGQSAHNFTPCKAVDIIPYNGGNKIDWEDDECMRNIRAHLEDLATKAGIKLKPVISWDKNHHEMV